MKTKLISGSEDETRSIAKDLARGLEPGTVLCLTGPLGSGKTRFVQGLAAGLGCKARVTSPTFTIVREYKGRKVTLYHIDLYRIAGADLRFMGWEDYLEDPKGICAIEWGEVAGKGLPKGHIAVRIEPLDDTRRRIEVER